MTKNGGGNHTRNEQLPDLICLSHLRWGFVYQRPQHLMSRFAKQRRVFFLEEPVISNGHPWLEMRQCPQSGVRIVTPHFPSSVGFAEGELLQEELLFQLIASHRIRDYVLWYYTPMALGFTSRLSPRAVIYDCMDELSGFKGAPPQLLEREHDLFRRANHVFTGGHSLYEAKRGQHPSVHGFPSSVDVPHFAAARNALAEPADQAGIPHPRFGFCGVIDERMDVALLDSVAAERPDWQFVMIGPIVKIDPAALPKRPNIHYLGGKTYSELPAYLAAWDVAIMPFAHNDATRFISPTKTPEYLAAGKPVISTSIRDVVRPYGELGLAKIADTVAEFTAAGDALLASPPEEKSAWRARADEFLSALSWDKTWTAMNDLVTEASRSPRTPAVAPMSSQEEAGCLTI